MLLTKYPYLFIYTHKGDGTFQNSSVLTDLSNDFDIFFHVLIILKKNIRILTDINLLCKVKISVIISKVYRKSWSLLSGVGISECMCIYVSEVIGHRCQRERNRCTDALPGLSRYNMFPEVSTALRYFFTVVYEYMESIQTALTHSS